MVPVENPHSSNKDGTKTHVPVPKSGSKYCLARWCSNSKGTHSSIRLFRLPMKKDPKRAYQWLKSADRDDLKDKTFSYLHSKYLCSDHFTEDMFMNSQTKNSLKWDAVPQLFPIPQNILRANSSRAAREHSEKELVTAYTSRHGLRQVCPKYTTRTITDKDGNVPLESTESITTPTEAVNKHVETLQSEISDRTETNNIDLWTELFETYGNAIEINYNEACDSMDLAVTSELETGSVVVNDPTCVLDLAEHTGTSDMMHACPSCGEMFLALSDLIRHQRSFHYQSSAVP